MQITPEMFLPIKLGMKIRDRVTGFIGTAYQIMENSSGLKQIAIQPYNDTGDSIKDINSVDLNTLEIVDAEHLTSIVLPFTPSSLNLGDKVTHRSGVKGVLQCEHIFMNGCAYFTMESDLDKDGKRGEGIFASANSFTLIEPTTEKVVRTKTGGPTQKAHRAV